VGATQQLFRGRCGDRWLGGVCPDRLQCLPGGGTRHASRSRRATAADKQSTRRVLSPRAALAGSPEQPASPVHPGTRQPSGYRHAAEPPASCHVADGRRNARKAGRSRSGILSNVSGCVGSIRCLPNGRVDRPRRANASQRSGRTRCYAAGSHWRMRTARFVDVSHVSSLIHLLPSYVASSSESLVHFHCLNPPCLK
jgi:hypothetical protein